MAEKTCGASSDLGGKICPLVSIILTTVHASLYSVICICFTQFFTVVHIVERLVLQKIYVVNKEIFWV